MFSNFRYSRHFSAVRKSAKYLLSLLYWPVIKIWPLPIVQEREITIVELINNRKSIIRFGDGEILYLTDRLNLPFQRYDIRLASILVDILKSDFEGLIVGLPNAYISDSATSEMHRIFWRSQIVWNYPRFRKFLKKNKIYGNASITRVYYGLNNRELSNKYFNQLKQIWNNKNILVIEGEKTRFGVGNDLLSNALSVKRILGPKHDAFSKFDEILSEARKTDKNTLILVALGPAAKAIVYYLFKIGYQCLDIGNLDIEYEWFLANRNERILVPGKYVSEVKGGREVADILDDNYRLQIIAEFL